MSLLNDNFLTLLKEESKKSYIDQYKPWQMQALFHNCDTHGRILIGGNRAGKTVSGAAESVFRLRGNHPYQRVPEVPVFGRGSAVDIEKGLNSIMLPELRRWIPPSLLIGGSWDDSYNKQARLLTLSNGSQMDFMTYEQEAEKHAGTSRDFIWFDEEPPQFIFNEDLLRLVDRNGKWWITMTPVLGMTWVYYTYYRPLVEEMSTGLNVRIFQGSSENNPHISKQALDIITEGLSEEEKQARRHGKFMAASGLIFPSFKEGVHTIAPINPHDIKTPIYACMDHGLRVPTAWLWFTVDSESRIIVFHEYYQAERTVEQHARAIQDWENRALTSEVLYRVGDPAISKRSDLSGGSIQGEYSENGIHIGSGNNEVKYGLNRVRKYFDNDGLFITQDCTALIRELRGYRWATYSTRKSNDTKQAQDAPTKLNDHAVDALRYGICSRPEDEFSTGAPSPLQFPAMNASTEAPVEVNYSYEDLEPINSNFHVMLGDDY